MQHYRRIALFLTSLLVSQAALAGEEEAAFEASMPTRTNFERLKQRIVTNPNNLELYFAYAQMARVLRRNEDAAVALENMLQADPTLSRVRLELALVYMELGRYDEAEMQFDLVEASNPPPAVKANIDRAKTVLEKLSRKHIFGGSLSVGFNNDSNANSAPGSGNVLVLDTILPLDASAGEQEDWHLYTAATLNHTYRFDAVSSGPQWTWNSSLLGYGTNQHDMEELDLLIYNFRTGPDVVLPASQSHFALTASYLFTDLDTHAYLRNPKIEFLAETIMLPNLTLYWRPSYEYREFVNTDVNTTYSDRSGEATQHMLGMRMALSERDLVDSYFLLRSEKAKENFHANKQLGLYSNFIHSFSESLLGLVSLSYKESRYEQADPLISTSVRQNDEYSAALTMNKTMNLPKAGDVVFSASYQYRDVKSNIQNYEYNNHRLTLSATKNF